MGIGPQHSCIYNARILERLLCWVLGHEKVCYHPLLLLKICPLLWATLLSMHCSCMLIEERSIHRLILQYFAQSDQLLFKINGLAYTFINNIHWGGCCLTISRDLKGKDYQITGNPALKNFGYCTTTFMHNARFLSPNLLFLIFWNDCYGRFFDIKSSATTIMNNYNKTTEKRHQKT